MNLSDDLRCDVWVCTDCYFAHHYGPYQDENGVWFSNFNSDTPSDREPLSRIVGATYVADNTDSETGDGVDEFSWSTCDGCGSTLGGSRYRLAVWFDNDNDNDRED
jgi:hypothetical protein